MVSGATAALFAAVPLFDADHGCKQRSRGTRLSPWRSLFDADHGCKQRSRGTRLSPWRSLFRRRSRLQTAQPWHPAKPLALAVLDADHGCKQRSRGTRRKPPALDANGKSVTLPPAGRHTPAA